MIMENIKIKRLDHLGIVSGIIQDLEIVEKIDIRVTTDAHEEITTGEAVAGMILNGLGFSNRPLSLVPQFFEDKPVEHLFREDVKSEHFNRFKLGRSLDLVNEYGCDCLFSEIAMEVCEQEKVKLRYNCLDTTTFSLTGKYDKDSDENEIKITQGYSKDHRPDLKQTVLELMVSQDGGIPFMEKAFSGNESDNNIFRERSKKLIEEFGNSETPRYLIADSKLYSAKNATNLQKMGFITRVPNNISVVKEVVKQSWKQDIWKKIDEVYSYDSVELGHYEIDQRWIIVYSKNLWDQSEITLAKAEKKEREKTEKEFYHLQAQRFTSQKKAQKALDKIASKLLYHDIDNVKLTQHEKYATKGRPKADSPKIIQWQISAQISSSLDKIKQQRQLKSCYVLSTNVPRSALSDSQLLDEYKSLSHVESGFRFLKDPAFFTSSLFLKKPCRIQGLLMVMTFALLVYSIAQRRMRANLADQNDTLPNQIGQPISTPTLRWVFQMLQGIHFVSTNLQGTNNSFVEGLNDLKVKILTLFGPTVAHLYKIPDF